MFTILKSIVRKLLKLLTGRGNLLAELSILHKNGFTLYEKRVRKRCLIAYYIDTKNGLVDRLKGIISSYLIAIHNNRPFKLYHHCGFDIERYLAPNLVDWHIELDEISFALNKSRPIFEPLNPENVKNKGIPVLSEKVTQFQSYCLYDIIPIIKKDEWSNRYHELFKPSIFLENMVREAKKHFLGNNEYVCVHMRFLNFFDNVEPDGSSYKPAQTKEEQHCLYNKCIKALNQIHQEHKSLPILLFSDSNSFLEMSFPDYVIILPGKVAHIGNASSSLQTYDKTFLDLYMMAGAVKVINVTGKNMWPSGFCQYAAKIGRVAFERYFIEED